MNYYDILGIEKSATQEEIKQTYRSLVKKYHPDVNTAKNANTFFNLIQEAYNTLSDDKSRKDYDLSNKNCEINNNDNTNYSNKDEKDDSWFNSQPLSDEEINEYIRREKSERSILIKILIILLKIILVVLLPILSFTKHVSMWISGIIMLIFRIIMGIGILLTFFTVYQILSGSSDMQWKYILVPLMIAFLGFCIPYIVIMIPVGLEILKDKIQDFIFE